LGVEGDFPGAPAPDPAAIIRAVVGFSVEFVRTMLAAATKFLTTLQERLNPFFEPRPDAAVRIADIRQAMLDSLGPQGRQRHPYLEQRILQASSVPALWFLRPELLMVLAAQHGEQAAREIVDEISALFEGLLPAGLQPRAGAMRR